MVPKLRPVGSEACVARPGLLSRRGGVCRQVDDARHAVAFDYENSLNWKQVQKHSDAVPLSWLPFDYVKIRHGGPLGYTYPYHTRPHRPCKMEWHQDQPVQASRCHSEAALFIAAACVCRTLLCPDWLIESRIPCKQTKRPTIGTVVTPPPHGYRQQPIAMRMST
jgi:hypothetical protein